MGGSWLVLLVFTGLATFRLTRFVVRDDFPLIAVPRRWVVGETNHTYDHEQQKWLPENKHEGRWWYWFGELVSCHWCASGWIALGITFVAALATGWDVSIGMWFLLWVATWALGSVLADRLS
jgi:hypothetical protein